MSSYIFQPPSVVAVPVRGSDALLPIRRIFCVGRNYEAHAREMGSVADRSAPFYFMKDASAYVPSGGTMAYAPGTGNLHYEMEFVVVIGRAGFQIPQEQALDYVFGYACGLDMTRRDLQTQAKDQQRPWDLGKNFEQSAGLSEIVPATQCGHPARGSIELWLNGELRQSADIATMVHPVPALVAHLSRYYHLQPGDLIYTGTPEGVGPVAPGDRITGSIEGVGDIALAIGPAA